MFNGEQVFFVGETETHRRQRGLTSSYLILYLIQSLLTYSLLKFCSSPSKTLCMLPPLNEPKKLLSH